MDYKRAAILLLSFMFAISPVSIGQAKNLSGNRGKVRAMGQFPGGGCAKLFDRYIAASGHSAYATTVTGQYTAAVCGIALNRRSQKQAEKDAVKACRDGDAQWKVEQLSGCYVGASK